MKLGFLASRASEDTEICMNCRSSPFSLALYVLMECLQRMFI